MCNERLFQSPQEIFQTATDDVDIIDVSLLQAFNNIFLTTTTFHLVSG